MGSGVGIKAQNLYQGSDWQTYRYAVAQVFDTLDQIREVAAAFLSGMNDDETPPQEQLSTMLGDLCNDLVSEVDLALADLSPVIAKHLPSRWLMVELRAIVGQLLALNRPAVQDHDLIPQLADLAERARFLMQRLDQ